MTPSHAQAAEAATVWVCGRTLDKSEGGEFRFTTNMAVFVGPFVITVAHGCTPRSGPVAHAMMSPNGPLLPLSRDGLRLGMDPHMTVSLRRPTLEATLVASKKIARAQERVSNEGGHLLSGPDERRVRPVFVEPYSDVGVLADHPRAPGALEMLRRDRKPLKVRRRPLHGVEPIFVRGDRGWAHGLARALLGPNAEALTLEDAAFEPGCCGGPVIDSRGELVGVFALAPANKEPDGSPVTLRGPLAQLCLSLPAWVLAELP